MTTPERSGSDLSWLTPVALLVVAPLMMVAGWSPWLGLAVVLGAGWLQHRRGWL